MYAIGRGVYVCMYVCMLIYSKTLKTTDEGEYKAIFK